MLSSRSTPPLRLQQGTSFSQNRDALAGYAPVLEQPMFLLASLIDGNVLVRSSKEAFPVETDAISLGLLIEDDSSRVQ